MLQARDPEADSEYARWLARIVLAAADGLQLRWRHDLSTDMAADLERLFVHTLRQARYAPGPAAEPGP